MRLRRSSSIAFALALLARAAHADEPRQEGADEVVVQGRSAGGFVSRMNEKDAPRELTDAASLVEPLPGVHVRRLGADDSFATLSVRGTSSTQVAVYLAGVPLSGGADPTLDLSTLPLWPGAQARVYRSFAPAALGRGSLGGTLVLDPPSPRGPQHTEVWSAIGSFGQRRVRIGDVHEVPGTGIRIASGLSASRSDDDFDVLDVNATAREGVDVFETRQNAGHAAASGLVSVALPIDREGKGALTATLLAQARKQRLPGPLNALTPFQRLDSSRLVNALELTYAVGAGVLGVRGWARREGLALRDTPDPRLRLGGTASRTDDAIVAAGSSAGYKARAGEASTIELRVDGSAERYAPGTWEEAATPPSARRTNGGLALDAETRVLESRALVLAASGRADTWHDTGADASARTTTKPTGHLGAEWSLGPVVLATHGGVLARPASFVERFGNRGAFLPAPDLKPESATTLDVGGKWQTKMGSHVRLALESAAFGTWADDLIVLVNTGAYGRARATNIGTARLFGLESELRVKAWTLDLRVAHTALATENGSACSFANGRCERPALPGRPAHDVVLDLGWDLGPLRLRYGLDVTTGIQANLTGGDAGFVPDRALHSVGAKLDVREVPGLTASFDVRNLFDLRAVDYAGALGTPLRAPIGDIVQYPLPGRRFLFALRYAPR